MNLRSVTMILLGALALGLSACKPGTGDVLKARVVSAGGPTAAGFLLLPEDYAPAEGDVLEYKYRTNVTGGQCVFAGPEAPDSAPAPCFISEDMEGWQEASLPLSGSSAGVKAWLWGIFETGARAEVWLGDVRVTNGGSVKLDLVKSAPALLETARNTRLAVMDLCPEQEPLRDTLTWMDSMLPEDTYVASHAESLDRQTGRWTSGVGVFQPIKTRVFTPWNTVFWHKDSHAKFYGELFTFDDRLLRLHTETFPAPTPADPEDQAPWTESPERVRIFVQDRDGKDTHDMALGRIMAYLDGRVTRRIDAWADTFIASSYAELNGKPRKFQNNVHDVTYVTREKNFSTVYDGEMEGWKADPGMKDFDEAFIINQTMNDNAARERFIFARKGETYYGIVRWDNSVMEDGKWKVVDRAVGLKTAQSEGPFPFDGFYDRVVNEKRIAPSRTAFTAEPPGPDFGSLTVTNTGSEAWSRPLLWARLRNKDYTPVEGSETIVARGQAQPLLKQQTFRLDKPKKWPKGEYYVEFDVTDGGEKAFSEKSPFVRFAELK